MRIFFTALVILGLGTSSAKAGYTVEFTFESVRDPLPFGTCAKIKIKQFGFDKKKILETTHQEGDPFFPSKPFVIKIDDSANNNYISQQQLSDFYNQFFDFSNQTMSQEEYNKFFQYIQFEVNGESLFFHWAPQDERCLHYVGEAENCKWYRYKENTPFKNRKTEIYVHNITLRFQKLDNKIEPSKDITSKKSASSKRTREDEYTENNLVTKKINIKNNPVALWDAAKYLILLEKDRLQNEVIAPPLNRGKLQKLCYYSQGFYLAKCDTPLFEEDFLAYDIGPYNEDLNNQCNALYDESNLNIEKLNNFRPSYRLMPSQMDHLTSIFKMQQNKSNKTLRAEYHLEDPWVQSRNSIMAKDQLKVFFKKEEQQKKLSPYVYKEPTNTQEMDVELPKIQNIFIPINAMSTQILIDYLNAISQHNDRQNINSCLKRMKDLAAVKNGHSIITLYDYFPKIENPECLFASPNQLLNGEFCDIWPGQTALDKILSFLFFPKEVEELDEPAALLYGRDHILTKLAYAARHNNLLALYRLVEAFKFYEGDLTQDGDEEDEEKEQRNFKKEIVEMRKKLENLLHEELQHVQLNEHSPYFSLGRLYYFIGNQKKASELFETGYKAGDPRSAWAYTDSLDDDQQKIRIYEEIAPSFPTALTELAQFAQTAQESYALCIEAGNKGVADGYYRAANMITNGYFAADEENYNPVKLYIKAGDLGHAGAYGAAAERCPEQAEKLYKQQGELGDPFGYDSLGKLYASLGRMEESQECFAKIEGPNFFKGRAAINNVSVDLMHYYYFNDLFLIVTDK